MALILPIKSFFKNYQPTNIHFKTAVKKQNKILKKKFQKPYKTNMYVSMDEGISMKPISPKAPASINSQSKTKIAKSTFNIQVQ